MDETICVLDVNIDNCPAKHALRAMMDYMATEPLNVVELVTIDTLLYAREHPDFAETLAAVDLVLPGQKEILEAAGITESRRIRETEDQTCLRLCLKYLQRNHRRVYLMTETDEQLDGLTACLTSRYRGLQIAGAAKVAPGSEADDLLVNAVNGADADCILAGLPSPVQEEFIARNRTLINARMWLGAGRLAETLYRGRTGRGGLFGFLDRMFFRREVEKNRPADGNRTGNS